jgi:CDP-diacylglycerol--glycerol-3-phosphate 3-phosphatidyltransferase
MTWTIPNILSVIRVVAAPCVAFAFAALDRPDADRAAVLIFLVAAFTDYLDGSLARRLGQESAFGRMLDPVADKAMVSIALAVIVAIYDLEWPILVPAALILLREVLISGLREFLGDVKLQVTKLAKWKTTLQMTAICLLLLRGALTSAEGAGPRHPAIGQIMEMASVAAGGLGLLLLWVAAWFTLVTGWDYFRKGMPYIQAKEAGTVEPAPESPAKD